MATFGGQLGRRTPNPMRCSSSRPLRRLLELPHSDGGNRRDHCRFCTSSSPDSRSTPIAGPRALLQAQLAQLASRHNDSSWPWLFQFTWIPRYGIHLCGGAYCRRQVPLGAFHTPQRKVSGYFIRARTEPDPPTLHRVQAGELRSAMFVQWLARKWWERYQRRCVKRSFGSTASRIITRRTMRLTI